MAKRTANAELKQFVTESGWTYAALARAVRVVAAEHGETLRTNKSTVEHWLSGTIPAGKTGCYLAIALSRRLGRILTEGDLGLPATDSEDDSIGLASAPIRWKPYWQCGGTSWTGATS
ncbi:hypothetical protein CUT44_31165 [Streptomyces carminius]|uniref:Transcriptional regulator n=1 Tax=Streptomyces carminius TaxID=2665496 RepID=A0A2M8LNZ5_9ACTN|nr:hypothetical protein [Streptomyces carminius]PJE93691.1 hypothetical protein CUT44_31165 [Streptomyces carminius]